MDNIEIMVYQKFNVCLVSLSIILFMLNTNATNHCMWLRSRLINLKTLERTNLEIIVWWEKRRVLFNLYVVFLSFLSFIITKENPLDVEMGTTKSFVFLCLVGLIIILNFFYTFGWVSELFKERSVTFAPKLFKIILLDASVLIICLISISGLL